MRGGGYSDPGARLLAPAARSGYDFAQTDQDRKDVSREHLISRPIN